MTDGFDPDAVEAVQLEDGSTAYIHHQTGGAVELNAEAIATLESYASKVWPHVDMLNASTGFQGWVSETGSILELVLHFQNLDF